MKKENNLKLVCFDLMDTIIIPPKKEHIEQWIREQYIYIDEYEATLFCNGYPYALFVKDSKLTFKEQKDILLINNINSYNDIYRLLKIKNITKYKEYITDKFIEFFINNVTIDINIKKFIFEKKENIKISIVSNLYSHYKKIIYKYDLQKKCDLIILSCDYGLRKPNNEIFSLINNFFYNYNFNEKYFLGDNWKSDIVPAYKAGLIPILINNRSEFIEYITEKGCAFLFKLENGNMYIKNKYKKNVEYYLSECIDLNNIKIGENLILENNKIIFPLLKCIIKITKTSKIKEII